MRIEDFCEIYFKSILMLFKEVSDFKAEQKLFTPEAVILSIFLWKNKKRTLNYLNYRVRSRLSNEGRFLKALANFFSP